MFVAEEQALVKPLSINKQQPTLVYTPKKRVENTH